MRTEDKTHEDKEAPVVDSTPMDLDDLDDMGLSGGDDYDDMDYKPSRIKNTAARKSIEQIMEERALKKQLSDVFDEDILLD